MSKSRVIWAMVFQKLIILKLHNNTNSGDKQRLIDFQGIRALERIPGSKVGWCWDLNFYNLLTLFRCQFCPKNLYKQQQKLFQQQRIVQSQRLKRVRQLLEDHTKNLQDLQRSHEAQQVTVQEQLRKEINMLQKKILTDTVRRSRGDVTVTSRFLEQN